MTAIASVRDVAQELEALTDEHTAYRNKRTGELILCSHEELSAAETGTDLTEFPEWQREAIEQAAEVLAAEDYLPLLSNYDVHEYRIMEDFCYSLGDERLGEKLLYSIRGGGAFRRFKDAIYLVGIDDDWYRFRQEALERIAMDWLEENGIPFSRDTGKASPYSKE